MSSAQAKDKVLEALILQEERPKDVATEIEARIAMYEGREFKIDPPRTVAILTEEYDWIKHYSLEHLLGQEGLAKQFLRVPPEVVDGPKGWGLKKGDKVSFYMSGGLGSIFAVNGYTDRDAFKRRPKLVTDIPSSYARERYALESIQLEKPTMPGEPDLNLINRVYGILSPYPVGGRVIFASPPWSGKSTALRAALKAFLRMMKDNKKLFIIVFQVGERPEDANELKEIMDSIDHDRNRSEIYLAPAADPKEEPSAGHYWLSEIVKARAERMTEGTGSLKKDDDGDGYHVVLLWDSLSRVALEHGYSEDIEKPKTSQLLSQGLPAISLTKTIDLFKVAGRFGDKRSLTVGATMLKDEVPVRKRRRAAEHIPYEQSAPSISSSIRGMASTNEETLKPFVDIDITLTRESHRLSTKGQYMERRDVIKQMWSANNHCSDGVYRTGVEKAVWWLLDYCRRYPIYEETQYYADYDK